MSCNATAILATMQGEIEAGEDVRTGEPAAVVTDVATTPAPSIREHASCRDCGAPLTGAFCAACGQRAQLHRSLPALGHDLLHGVLHFEGKFWRTLPELFFHPGRLTRRYIDGERTKFVSPMGLFLFTVFAMFAVFSWTADTTPAEASTSVGAGADDEARSTAYAIAESKSKIRALREQRNAAADAARRAELQAEIDELSSWLVVMEVLAGLRHGYTPDARDANAAREPLSVTIGWPALDRKLSEGLQQARENPRFFFYRVKSNAYKASWALIPLSVPFVWLLFFWRRDIPLYDHAVFATYSISFMMLLLIVLSLAASIGVSAAVWEAALTLIPPIHMYKQLRGAYGLSRLGAVVRLAVLLLATVVVLMLFGTLLIYIGVFG
jgi:hypothetical protein